MKRFILVTAMLLILSGGLVACGMPVPTGGDAQKSAVGPDADEHNRGGY
jgi:predicted small secreted protein